MSAIVTVALCADGVLQRTGKIQFEELIAAQKKMSFLQDIL